MKPTLADENLTTAFVAIEFDALPGHFIEANV
jgi:hypothetical protein